MNQTTKLADVLTRAGLDGLTAEEIAATVAALGQVNPTSLPLLAADLAGPATAWPRDARVAWWSAEHVPYTYKRLLDARSETDEGQPVQMTVPDIAQVWSTELGRFVSMGKGLDGDTVAALGVFYQAAVKACPDSPELPWPESCDTPQAVANFYAEHAELSADYAPMGLVADYLGRFEDAARVDGWVKAAAWEEAKHKRHPKGTPVNEGSGVGGGRFAPGGGGGDDGARGGESGGGGIALTPTGEKRKVYAWRRRPEVNKENERADAPREKTPGTGPPAPTTGPLMRPKPGAGPPVPTAPTTLTGPAQPQSPTGPQAPQSPQAPGFLRPQAAGKPAARPAAQTPAARPAAQAPAARPPRQTPVARQAAQRRATVEATRVSAQAIASNTSLSIPERSAAIRDLRRSNIELALLNGEAGQGYVPTGGYGTRDVGSKRPMAGGGKGSAKPSEEEEAKRGEDEEKKIDKQPVTVSWQGAPVGLEALGINEEWTGEVFGSLAGQGATTEVRLTQGAGNGVVVMGRMQWPGAGHTGAYMAFEVNADRSLVMGAVTGDPASDRIDTFGRDFISTLASKAAASGIGQITLDAGLSVGRYAWALTGAEYVDPQQAELTNQKFAAWASKRGIAAPPGGWPTFESVYDVATFEMEGATVKGDSISNGDIDPNLEMALGKAFMLDQSADGHGAWRGVVRLGKSTKSAQPTPATARASALAANLLARGHAAFLWPLDQPVPDGVTDAPFWPGVAGVRRTRHAVAPVKTFDESKIERWPEGTAVNTETGEGGGRFAPKDGEGATQDVPDKPGKPDKPDKPDADLQARHAEAKRQAADLDKQIAAAMASGADASGLASKRRSLSATLANITRKMKKTPPPDVGVEPTLPPAPPPPPINLRPGTVTMADLWNFGEHHFDAAIAEGRLGLATMVQGVNEFKGMQNYAVRVARSDPEAMAHMGNRADAVALFRGLGMAEEHIPGLESELVKQMPKLFTLSEAIDAVNKDPQVTGNIFTPESLATMTINEVGQKKAQAMGAEGLGEYAFDAVKKKGKKYWLDEVREAARKKEYVREFAMMGHAIDPDRFAAEYADILDWDNPAAMASFAGPDKPPIKDVMDRITRLRRSTGQQHGDPTIGINSFRALGKVSTIDDPTSRMILATHLVKLPGITEDDRVAFGDAISKITYDDMLGIPSYAVGTTYYLNNELSKQVIAPNIGDIGMVRKMLFADSQGQSPTTSLNWRSPAVRTGTIEFQTWFRENAPLEFKDVIRWSSEQELPPQYIQDKTAGHNLDDFLAVTSEFGVAPKKAVVSHVMHSLSKTPGFWDNVSLDSFSVLAKVNPDLAATFAADKLEPGLAGVILGGVNAVTGEITAGDGPMTKRWAESFGQHHGPQSDFTGDEGQKDAIATLLSKRAGVSYKDASRFVGQWAATSNDADLRALGIQEIAAEEFGVPVSKWQKAQLKLAHDKEFGLSGSVYLFEGEETVPTDENARTFRAVNRDEAKDMIRRLIHAVYDETQDWLKANGVTQVKAYRGSVVPMTFFKGGVPKEGDTISYDDNTLASWASQLMSADGFAYPVGDERTQKVRLVLETVLPADRVFSTARTGFGCLGENELLSLGNPGKGYAKVLFVRVPGEPGYDDDVIGV